MLHFGDIAIHVSVYVTKMSMSHVDNIANKILLFTNYGPTRVMNIHIYNYLKHNICLTKTKIQ
jgi:hypothetical protein